ncbi:Rv3235 family protein [Amycolatopsis sp. NPDC058278]|uniref:Rv3235 family protein n=1 Tax=unclassified Amycolatopsis TaxID=2618356 RepID=UPI00255C1FA0|nr:Rv3235 family protein [Amycolatopsis sp. DG1A-15b]WIX85346.1 Rv3235 family protein [Amycolatopsis sp. DG1A-15b]
MIEEHRLRTLIHCEAVRRADRPDEGTPREEHRGGGRYPAPRQLDAGEVGHLLNTLLEAYDGRRPAAQVRALVAPEVYAGFAGPRRTRPRHRTQTIHTCTPAPEVVEACARVEADGRSFALAARFTRTPTGWRCVRFALLKPQQPANPIRRAA